MGILRGARRVCPVRATGSSSVPGAPSSTGTAGAAAGAVADPSEALWQAVAVSSRAGRSAVAARTEAV